MVDLTTSFMGIKLKHPIVPSASPLSRNVATVKAIEDAGASAIVMHSLFEEQIEYEAEALDHFLEHGTESFAEALTYFPQLTDYQVGPEDYLEHIREIKESVEIPVIASLNGISLGGWVDYAKKIQQAGADGLELNIYFMAAGSALAALDVETLYLDILKAIKKNISIPVAVKLSPYFSALTNFAERLVYEAGADGLVLFNRFYQPDINLETREVVPNLLLSSPYELRLPLRWIAILYGQIEASLALTSGIHTTEGVLKAIMVGADVANVCSVLLKHGLGKITEFVQGIEQWMEEHGYDSIEQLKGSMSHQAVAEPAAFERANYLKVLQSYE
ncbi:MAG: dihydroorotate dehydrogenase-like protein [Anaerolineales bacterium]|nr:dihydroorotate dehydrogenase-like protein [Anaerolineales bacterium]